jgi:hypothetical protein
MDKKIKIKNANGTEKLKDNQPDKNIILGKTMPGNISAAATKEIDGPDSETNDASTKTRRDVIIFQTSKIRLGTESIPLINVHQKIKFS